MLSTVHTMTFPMCGDLKYMNLNSYHLHLDGWNTIQPHFHFDNYYLQKMLFSNFLHFVIFCTFLGWFSGFESYNNHLE